MRVRLSTVRLPRSGDSRVTSLPRAETCLSASGSSVFAGPWTSMDFTLWPSTVISESSSMVQPVDSPPMAMARVSLPVTETDFAGLESVEDWGSAELGARSRRSDRRNFVRMGRDYRTNERAGKELQLGR